VPPSSDGGSNNLEDSHLHTRRSENLKSHKLTKFLRVRGCSDCPFPPLYVDKNRKVICRGRKKPSGLIPWRKGKGRKYFHLPERIDLIIATGNSHVSERIIAE
jgi:hypothetical protein